MENQMGIRKIKKKNKIKYTHMSTCMIEIEKK